MKIFTIIVLMFMGILSWSQNINDSLIFYYPCNGNLFDDSGNGLNAETNGTLTEDEYGNPNSAYQLNGIDNYINIPYSSLYKVGFPATFRMRFKVNNFPEGIHASIFLNDFVPEMYFGFGVILEVDHKIGVFYGDGGGSGPQNRRSKTMYDTISAGLWHELVVIWHNPEDMHIYLDCQYKPGELSGTGYEVVEYSNQSAPAVVGIVDFTHSQPPTYFDGQVDEITFWSRALQVNEIIELCNNEVIIEIDEHFSNTQTVPVKVLSVDYYDILGRKIPKPNYGFYIERKLTDKGVITKKYNIQ
ncbi:MAG: hypothetical protein QM503_06265 [Bacteroidota bacterium]